MTRLTGAAVRAAVAKTRERPFGAVTSFAAAMIAGTSLLDLLLGTVHVPWWWTCACIALAAAISILPVALGEVFRPWMALVGCWTFGVVTVLQAGTANETLTIVNNLVLYPMISCYLGWFFPRFVARMTMLAFFAASGIGVLVGENPSIITTWANLALASLFCLEAALYLRAQNARQVETDPLTGALNRKGLSRCLGRDLAVSRRTGEALTVVAIDMDGFKALNDHLGHAAGDQVLVDLVATAKLHLRPRDSVARLGGDEFVLILPDTDPVGAERTVERLRASTDFPWSYGLAHAQAADTEVAILARADSRLYEHKVHRG